MVCSASDTVGALYVCISIRNLNCSLVPQDTRLFQNIYVYIELLYSLWAKLILLLFHISILTLRNVTPKTSDKTLSLSLSTFLRRLLLAAAVLLKSQNFHAAKGSHFIWVVVTTLWIRGKSYE